MKIKLFSNIGKAVVTGATKTKMKVVKSSPELLLGLGLVAGFASVVTACKATLKADEIVDEHEEVLEKIHKAAEKNSDYAENDQGRDLFNEAVKNAVRWMRLYAPSVALGGLAIVCILCSYGILKKRNAALTAAYTALEGVFKSYRERVVDRFGEKVDQELFYGKEEEEVEIEDPETGKKHKEKAYNVNDPEELAGSPYAVIFGPDNPNFHEHDDDANITFLRSMQSYWDDRLHNNPRLPVIYHDVLTDMGWKRPKGVALDSGWIVGNGDGYIDFRIKRIVGNADRRCFYYLLDPNVDGYIRDKI